MLPFAGADGGDISVPDPAGAGRVDGSRSEVAAPATDTVWLSLMPNPVFENGGRASVHARMRRAKKNSVITVTVSTSSDHVTQSGTTLTIPAGATQSFGTVVLTSVDNVLPDGDRTVEVTGTATGVANLFVQPGELEVVDDEGMAKLAFRLSSSSIYESATSRRGGVNETSVIVESSQPVAAPVSVSVSVVPNSYGATASDFVVSGSDLTIPAGSTRSTGEVKVTAVDNAVWNNAKIITVSGTVDAAAGLDAPASRNVIINNDDLPVLLRIRARPNTISEDGGVTKVTMTADAPVPEDIDVTLAVTRGDSSVITFGSNRTLRIGKGKTTSTDSVTVTAVDDTIGIRVGGYVLGLGRRPRQVSGSYVYEDGLHIYNDDRPPGWLLVSAERHNMRENEGPTRVFATLSQAPTDTVKIEVGIDDLTTADSTDYKFSTNRILTIPPGATTSTGDEVTLRPVDNDYYNPYFSPYVYLSGIVTKGQDQVAQVTTVSNIVILEDEWAPTVTLRLSSGEISEDGGTTTVTARLDVPLKGETTTVTVASDPVLPTTAAADFTQTGKTLTIAPGAVTSTGSVTITAVDNANAELGKTVSISGSVQVTSTNTGFYVGRIRLPRPRHLRIADDDSAPPPPPVEEPRVPAPPSGLEASANGLHIIDLSWSAPSEDGGAAISGYRIEVSADAGETWLDLVTTTEGGVTTYSHTGLPSAATRHYRVRAINSVGAGDPSNVASATTADVEASPSAPTKLEATADGHHAIVLSWTPPSDHGGTAISGYRIEVSADGGVTWRELVADTYSTSTTYVDVGVTAGTTRHYRISAINQFGVGEPSLVISATTPAAVSPSAPRDLSAIPGTVQVLLSWNPPTELGGADVERYEYRVDGAGDWLSVGRATRAAVTGLEPGRTYLFEVRAVNPAGPGPPASIGVTLNTRPAFTHSSYQFELAENVDGSASPVTLGTVLAEDADGDRVSYEIAAADTSLFRVLPTEGGVAYVGPGEDYESEPNRYDFAVRADDGHGASDTATVTVIVTPVNEPPEAADDDAETAEDQPVRIHPLDNDIDPDGDSLRVESASEAEHGTVEIVGGTTVLYSPDENWHGEDRFTYVASDGALTDEATVSVTVLPVNDAPETEGTIPDQMLEEGGDAVELDLTGYFSDVDGDSLALTASSADPAIVAVAVSGAILTMTPVAHGSTTIDVDAADPGNLLARQTFAVEVGDRLVKSVLADVFGAMGRGYLASMRSTLSRRDGAVPAMGESHLNVFGHTLPLGNRADWTETAAEALSDRIGDTCHGIEGGRDALAVSSGTVSGRGPDGAAVPGCSITTLGGAARSGGSDFQLVLAGGGLEPRGGGGTRWSLWSQGDIQSFSGSGSVAGGYNGELRNAYVGLDVQSDRWLAGLAYSRSTGTGDWDIGKAGGRVSTKLNSAHPYLRWSNGATSVWAMFGLGRGTAEHERTRTSTRETSGLGLTAGLIEVRHALRAAGTGPQVSLRGDAGWARLSTDSGRGTINGLDAAVRQTRLGMEFGWEIGTATSGLTPFGQVNMRRDDGAGQNGRGVELLGGLRARLGVVEVDAQGRSLAVHSAAGYSESGASVALRVGGNPGQPGLSLRVAPRWGAPAGPVSALWQDHMQAAAQGDVPADKGGMDASVGYGLPLGHDRILTPFARFAGSGYGRRLQFGVRLGSVELVSDLNPGMPGSRGHRLALAGRITFGAGTPLAIHPTNER